MNFPISAIRSLGDFKEHKTIDFRKGYLNSSAGNDLQQGGNTLQGIQDGTIHFLGNLEDLKRQDYAFNK